MAATLKLTHKAIGAEVRRDPYDVVLDRKRVESLGMNATVELPVEPGDHTLLRPRRPEVEQYGDVHCRRRRDGGFPVHRKAVPADIPGLVPRSLVGVETGPRVTVKGGEPRASIANPAG